MKKMNTTTKFTRSCAYKKYGWRDRQMDKQGDF